jgi:hypothetical protein
VRNRIGSARGQASLMMLAVVGLVLAAAVLLFAFGNALGAKGRQQRAADLAAITAAQAMRELYPRLFEPPSSHRTCRIHGTWRRGSTARWRWRPRSGVPRATARAWMHAM